MEASVGRAAFNRAPDELFHLPMFIMQDQPKHTGQRKEVAPMFTGAHLSSLKN